MNNKYKEVFKELESIIGKESLEEELGKMSRYYDIYSLCEYYSIDRVKEFLLKQIVAGDI